jgi:hypothetical protein
MVSCVCEHGGSKMDGMGWARMDTWVVGSSSKKWLRLERECMELGIRRVV